MTSEPLSQEAEDWRDAASIILRNWRDEIGQLARQGRVAMARQPSDGVRLVLSASEAVAQFESHGEIDVLGRFSRNAEGAEALRARLMQADLIEVGSTDTILQLDDVTILRSQVRLPKVAQGALRGALGFELERLSPIPPAELYFDFVVQNYDKTANRVELTSRAVRRRVVDDAVRFAQSAGLVVAGFQMGGDAEPGDWRQFPVDRMALARRQWRRWGTAMLAGLGVLLLLAVLLAVSARAALRDEALSASIADEEMRAAIVSRLGQKMDRIRGQAAFVAGRKAQPSFVSTLAALTEALPDDTWLIDIQLDGGKLHVQGFSRAASNLIARLDRSGHFSGTQFNAPLVRNDSDGTERFDLTTRVMSAR